MMWINWNLNSNYLFDDSLQYGRAVFETILVKNKAIFLKEHIERLNLGANKLEINNKVELKDIEKFIINNSIKNCSLKIILTEKNIILNTRELTYKKEDYKNGFKLSVSKVKRNSTSMITYLKSTNYIENIIEREKALKSGFNEVIFLNEKGFITEGSISNLYFIKNFKIKTAKVSSGLLDGTVRKWIISNFTVEEGDYDIEELLSSDAVFLSNSLMGIMKVSNIEDIEFKENELFNKIKNKYFEFLEDF